MKTVLLGGVMGVIPWGAIGVFVSAQWGAVGCVVQTIGFVLVIVGLYRDTKY